MLPLQDNIPSRTVPVVNWLMIGMCAVVFLLQTGEPPDGPGLIERYGMIPARIVNPAQPVEITVDVEAIPTRDGIDYREIRRLAAPSAVAPVLTMLTCIFLHGGWLHFLGNMWFLHIFGDNVEDRFGHVGYLIFYLVCGVMASLMHFLSDPGSTAPTIGASGAIAGVMGAYFVSYPHAQVRTLVPIVIFLRIMILPAPLFLGIWFLLQLLAGTASAEASGVAWWAHIGGFIAGAGIVLLLSSVHLLRPVNPLRRTIPTAYVYRRL